MCMRSTCNIEEQIIHGYPIKCTVAQGGCESYRWFVYITTPLLREASWSLDCIVEHPNYASAPSILLVLLEPHCVLTSIATRATGIKDPKFH